MLSPISLVRLWFLLLAITISGSACADVDKTTKNYSLYRFLTLFDANKDGKVDQNEFNSAAAERFNLMDNNGDKSINKAELLAYLQSRRKTHRLKQLKIIDIDHDQQISLNEFLDFKRHQAMKLFKYIDHDQNGMLDQKELIAFNDMPLPPRFGHRLFKKLDVNKDGAISQQESYQAWSRWFIKLDRNKDQKISKEDE